MYESKTAPLFIVRHGICHDQKPRALLHTGSAAKLTETRLKTDLAVLIKQSVTVSLYNSQNSNNHAN
jgi:hypothetical protein